MNRKKRYTVELCAYFWKIMVRSNDDDGDGDDDDGEISGFGSFVRLKFPFIYVLRSARQEIQFVK